MSLISAIGARRRFTFRATESRFESARSIPVSRSRSPGPTKKCLASRRLPPSFHLDSAYVSRACVSLMHVPSPSKSQSAGRTSNDLAGVSFLRQLRINSMYRSVMCTRDYTYIHDTLNSYFHVAATDEPRHGIGMTDVLLR